MDRDQFDIEIINLPKKQEKVVKISSATQEAIAALQNVGQQTAPPKEEKNKPPEPVKEKVIEKKATITPRLTPEGNIRVRLIAVPSEDVSDKFDEAPLRTTLYLQDIQDSLLVFRVGNEKYIPPTPELKKLSNIINATLQDDERFRGKKAIVCPYYIESFRAEIIGEK